MADDAKKLDDKKTTTENQTPTNETPIPEAPIIFLKKYREADKNISQ